MAEYCTVVFPLLTHQVFTYQTGEFAGRIKPGQRVLVPFGNRQRVGFVTALSDQAPGLAATKKVIKIIDSQIILSEKILKLAYWVADYYCAPVGEVLRLILNTSLKPPQREAFEEEIFYQGILTGVAHLVPTPEQEKVLERLKSVLLSGKGGVAALWGVAASGKTEIYLQLASIVAESGAQSLILVPEIVMVPQVEDWAKERFGNRVAILHSRLKPSQHYRLLCQAQKGKISVLIGTRSAVFVPLANLRLIVVDEEFDRSYKETRIPRYHAREVAIKRGEIENALVLLGSATPSLEVYRKAKEGEILFFSLAQRISISPFPKVYFPDLKYYSGCQRRKRKQPIISERLRSLIEERLLRGEQSIIFVNRRGRASYLFCENCGYLFLCPVCSVSMVYHHTTGELYCHYCDHHGAIPETCPSCNQRRLGRFSVGTQVVEKELKRSFPEVRILRLDSDTLEKQRKWESIRAFRKGKYQILVGTQMVTKGHHFPAVTLVGVLSADSILNLPDFRAAERSFQILTQVAGRAGRALPNAEVFIQTYYPQHYAYTSIASNHPEEFYEKELAYRKEAGYPPYGYLANIIFSGRREKSVVKKAEEWAELAKKFSSQRALQVFGPAACFHKKLKDRYRWHIILKSTVFGLVQEFFRSLPKRKVSEKGVTIDIDPIDLF